MSADQNGGSERLQTIDLLRGLVMALMALDHARDFWFDASIIVERTPEPGAVLFLTRWITHFCAPVFVFLAGASVWLWRSGGRRGPKSVWQTSRYLVSRGLWLIALEWTAVHFAWFGPYTGFLILQVIAAIGFAMLALALLVHLPRGAVLVLGLAAVGGHNLLDAHACENPYGGCPWWQILCHQEGLFALPSALQFGPNTHLFVKYPILPWIGVISIGYGMGGVFQRARSDRRARLFGFGLAATAGFVLLRAANGYGDPVRFADQTLPTAEWMRFLNCEKYPPSLLFVLMTLGPAWIFMALVDGSPSARSTLGRWLTTFGKVPLFYYLGHVLILRLSAEAWYGRAGGEVPGLLLENFDRVEGYGLPLWAAYGAWVATMALLYWPCKWYGALKRRSRNPLLTYL